MSLSGTSTPVRAQFARLQLAPEYGQTGIPRWVKGIVESSFDELAPYETLTGLEQFLTTASKDRDFSKNFEKLIEELQIKLEEGSNNIPFTELSKNLLSANDAYAKMNLEGFPKEQRTTVEVNYYRMWDQVQDAFVVGLQKANIWHGLLKYGFPLVKDKLSEAKRKSITAKLLNNQSKILTKIMLPICTFLSGGMTDYDFAYTHFQMINAHSGSFFQNVTNSLEVIESLDQLSEIARALIAVRKFYALSMMDKEEKAAVKAYQKTLARLNDELKQPISNEAKSKFASRCETLNKQYAESTQETANAKILGYFHKLHEYNEQRLTPTPKDAKGLDDSIATLRKALMQPKHNLNVNDSIFELLLSILRNSASPRRNVSIHELLSSACDYYKARIEISTLEGKLFLSLLQEIRDNFKDKPNQIDEQVLRVSEVSQSTNSSTLVAAPAVAPAVAPAAAPAVAPAAAPAAAPAVATNPASVSTSVQALTADLQELEKSHVAEMKDIAKQGQSDLEKQKIEIQKSIDRQRSLFAEEKRAETIKIEEDNRKALADFKVAQVKLLEAFKKKYEAQVQLKQDELQTIHTQNLSDLETNYEISHAAELAKLESKSKNDIEEMQKALDGILASIKTKIEAEKAAHLARKEKEYEAEKNRTHTNCLEATRKLQAELEDLIKKNKKDFADLQKHCAQLNRQAIENATRSVRAKIESEKAQHAQMMNQQGDVHARESFALKSKVIDTMALPANVRIALRLLADKGIRLYVVGGSVRKRRLGRLSAKDDFDVMVDAEPEAIQSILGDLAKPEKTEKTLIKILSTNIELWCEPWTGLATKEELTEDPLANIKKSLNKRDFTIGTFMWSVDGQIFDVLGHIDDLEPTQWEVKLLGSIERLREDFSLALRWARIAAEYSKLIPSTALTFIRSHVSLVKTIPYGRYFKNLKSMFINTKNVAILDKMIDDNLLMLLPWMPHNHKELLNGRFPYLIEFWKHKLKQYSTSLATTKLKHIMALFILFPILIKKSEQPDAFIEVLGNAQLDLLTQEYRIVDEYGCKKMTEIKAEIPLIYAEYQQFQFHKLMEASNSSLDVMAGTMLTSYENQPVMPYVDPQPGASNSNAQVAHGNVKLG